MANDRRTWSSVFFFLLVFMSTQVSAHGDLGMRDGVCNLAIGPANLEVKGKQPLTQPTEFCEDVPNKGPTFWSFLIPKKLRSWNFEVRLFKDVGQKDDSIDLENTTVYYNHSFELDKDGFAIVDTNLEGTGKFIGVAKLTSPNGRNAYVARFPFKIGNRSDVSSSNAKDLQNAEDPTIGSNSRPEDAKVDTEKTSGESSKDAVIGLIALLTGGVLIAALGWYFLFRRVGKRPSRSIGSDYSGEPEFNALEKLHKLKEQGILTEEEFAIQKKIFLNKLQGK